MKVDKEPGDEYGRNATWKLEYGCSTKTTAKKFDTRFGEDGDLADICSTDDLPVKLRRGSDMSVKKVLTDRSENAMCSTFMINKTL